MFKQVGEVLADATLLYVHHHIFQHLVGTWIVLATAGNHDLLMIEPLLASRELRLVDLQSFWSA